MEAGMGPDCFAVRGILFNKADGANWKVAWHQDCVIAGARHVRPSSHIMSRMLAIRIHWDESGADNGPLRVVPGSHNQGFLSHAQIQNWPKDNAMNCIARRGDAARMRPLLLHASTAAKSPGSRRVVHLEFAADQLPAVIEWRDRV
jgi:ectoine hydroxylase-related dioxygenase (phytanoyl-CoA dioxygenase family)